MSWIAAAAGEGAANPAGGAALGEIAIATGGATVLTAALLYLGLGHRQGSNRWLAKAAARSERMSGLPGWASLPMTVATISLVTAVFGMYWDIALHIDVGRDEGPLANPAHYFILAGLFGIFSAGYLAMVLPESKPGPTAIPITRTWHAPLGGVLIAACGAFSLIGFPLDDMWHRLFGQDVTLWGPTHLMLIGGAAMTLIGIAVLAVEGLRSNAVEARAGNRRLQETGFAQWARRVALTGGLLLGLSTFQAEFDFGVPQFRFVFAPMLVSMAAAVGLVATRAWLGRGSAVGAVLFFWAIRGLLALAVGPIFGEATPYFPLFMVSALIVEGVALLVPPSAALRFGAICGVLIGTLGLASEWAWSQVFMPLPWPAELLPEGAILGFAMALSGALIGAWVGAKLDSDRTPSTGGLRIAAAAGAAVVAVCVGIGLHKPTEEGIRGTVALTEVQGGEQRTVRADVRIDPPSAARDAEWLTATAWQGGVLVVDRLEQVGPGRYRTTRPIPVHGNWKSLIRLHKGSSLAAIPLFLPEDPAIPAKEIPAPAQFEREFVADHTILQREQKAAAPALTAIAYGVVLLIALGLLTLLVWGLHRLGRHGAAAPPAPAEDGARRGAAAPRRPSGATRSPVAS